MDDRVVAVLVLPLACLWHAACHCAVDVSHGSMGRGSANGRWDEPNADLILSCALDSVRFKNYTLELFWRNIRL